MKKNFYHNSIVIFFVGIFIVYSSSLCFAKKDPSKSKEIDPIYSASTAALITDTDINNWNLTHNWGNHATAGYLITESDPIFKATNTEAKLESHLIDINNIYTNKDGNLDDDNLSDNSIDHLIDVDLSNLNPDKEHILKYDPFQSKWVVEEYKNNSINVKAVLKGTIKGAHVKYKSSTQISITSGYGECNDKYWEISSPVNIDLGPDDQNSIPYGEDFIYIYIDYSELENNSSDDYTPTIIATSDEPAWNGLKQGWYRKWADAQNTTEIDFEDQNDRCIGVVWSPNGSKTLLNFMSNSKNIYMSKGSQIKTILSKGITDGRWHAIEATTASPVNSIAIFVYARNGGAGAGPRRIHILPYEMSSGTKGYEGTINDVAYVIQWFDLEIGWSRDLKYFGDRAEPDDYEVRIYGYQIER